MHHSLVPTAVSYQNVFGNHNIWNPLTLLVVGIVIEVALLFLCARVGKGGWGILLFAISSTVCVIGAGLFFGFMAPNIGANMNADLKEKYSATLADPLRDIPDNLEDMTQEKSYQLVGPDGKTATYLVKWDRTTSEPTIVSDPTLPILNAAK